MLLGLLRTPTSACTPPPFCKNDALPALAPARRRSWRATDLAPAAIACFRRSEVRFFEPR